MELLYFDYIYMARLPTENYYDVFMDIIEYESFTFFNKNVLSWDNILTLHMGGKTESGGFFQVSLLVLWLLVFLLRNLGVQKRKRRPE